MKYQDRNGISHRYPTKKNQADIYQFSQHGSELKKCGIAEWD
jgi:hypothetical protein